MEREDEVKLEESLTLESPDATKDELGEELQNLIDESGELDEETGEIFIIEREIIEEEWGEIEDPEDIDDLDIIVDDTQIETDTRKEGEFEEFIYCCRVVCKNETINMCKMIMTLLNTKYDLRLECKLNELRSAVYETIVNINEFDDIMKINILDNFLRGRHENLSYLVSCVIGENFVKTDVSFSEKYGIDSDRTPDFIISDKEHNKELIIEIAAVSDPERAFKSKGDINKGYKSKYDIEIEHLRNMGKNVDYYVLVFNISDSKDNDYNEILKQIAKTLNRKINIEHLSNLEYLRKEYCTLTYNLNNVIGDFYSYLFGDPYAIKDPDDLSDLNLLGEPINAFSGHYNRVGVSNLLYDKVVSSLPRFYNMLERAHKNSASNNFKLIYNNNTSKFLFVEDDDGPDIDTWIENINNEMKTWICQNLVFQTQGYEGKTPKADFEFFTYDKKQTKAYKAFKPTFTEYYNNTHPRLKVFDYVNLKDFKIQLQMRKYVNMSSKYEDEDYEDKIMTMIDDFDKNCKDEESLTEFYKKLIEKPLCYYKVNDKLICEAISLYDNKLAADNCFNDKSNFIYWLKQPFIYPVANIKSDDFCDYKEKPIMLKELSESEIGPYTNRIVNACMAANFSFGTERISKKLIDELEPYRIKVRELNQKSIVALKDFNKSDEWVKIKSEKRQDEKKFPTLKDLGEVGEKMSKELSEANLSLRKKAKDLHIVDKNLSVIKLPTKPNSILAKEFKLEMDHFKSKNDASSFKGVGQSCDYKFVDNMMKLLKESFFEPNEKQSPDTIMDKIVDDDNFLLKSLKINSLNEYSPYHDFLSKTKLYHTVCFITRFCHTLLYHSQTSLNSSNVTVDNLGYKNVLLMIKGGKKIFPTKRSKLFKMCYPSFSIIRDMYIDSKMQTSFRSFNFGDRVYMVTPWMNMHETVLTDGITLSHRLLGFAILNYMPEKNYFDNLDRVYFNILLALHNRRQTETILHNLRYVFMNCMSEVSAITGILPELSGFNYDMFQYWIRNKLSLNFQDFANRLNKIHEESGEDKPKNLLIKANIRHPFNDHVIDDYNTLALGVYSSYLMSKAPTTQSLEQVSNLKSMMETHKEFKEKIQTIENCYVNCSGKSLDEYYNDLFENDFKMDPSFCLNLGKFMGDYLSNLETKTKMWSKWENILEQPWDKIANTKGLRGDDSDFFGSKGYYIVYKDILKNNNKLKEINEILDSEEDDHKKAKKIRTLNETFRDKIKTQKLDEIVFHVVDKKQRGGKREIFVMDKQTKIHQNILEEYMGYLCKLTPHEMISIPSNKRLSTIHSRVFEDTREYKEKYYWVLDCRKWAPKSIIEKFILFLLGAKHILPPSFIVHALNFFSKLRKKRVYTRPHILDIVVKSKGWSDVGTYFNRDDKRKGVYFNMEYSWVMGIFNYFSSIMHVGTQLYSAYLIRNSAMKNLGSENILHMVAHSDDSAGKILVNNRFEMLRSSILYETFMHASNHLLSKKKSNKGKMYYEFVSILYIGGELLSLLAKFTGIFNFHPTDKGYCSDMNDTYSKCIELVSNGATFDQAYIAMKIQSNLIYKFYFGNIISKNNYKLPVEMFGVPDSHPLMVMMLGSDADLFRLFYVNDDNYKKKLICIDQLLSPADSNCNSLLKQFNTTPNVNPNNKLRNMIEKYEVPDLLKNTWTMKNVNFKNTAINSAQFLQKLTDKNFLASLQDETIVRRISRSYFARSHLSIKTSYGEMNPKQLRELIYLITLTMEETNTLNELTDSQIKLIKEAKIKMEEEIDKNFYLNLFEFLYHEPIRLYKYFDSLNLKVENYEEYRKTCKPIYLKIQKTLDECPVNYDSSALTSWIKEPQFRHLIQDTRGYLSAENYLTTTLAGFGIDLSDLSTDQTFLICRKLKQKSSVEYFCYSNVPSSIREISNYQDILNFLAHNSKKGFYIKGLSVQFRKTISVQMEDVMPELSSFEVQWTLSFYQLLSTVISTGENLDLFLNLECNEIGFLNNKKMLLSEVINLLDHYWSRKPKIFKYFKVLHQCLSYQLKGQSSFPAEYIMDTFFHAFIKRQFLLDNVWLGVGKLYVNAGDINLVLIIVNIKVVKVVLNVNNYIFTDDQIKYINLCLRNAQLPNLTNCFNRTEIDDWNEIVLGMDDSGTCMVTDARNTVTHIKLNYDITLGTPLSNFKHGRIVMRNRMRMIWSSNFGDKEVKFNLNSLPLEPEKSLSLLNGLIINNKHNNDLMLTSGKNNINYLFEMCCKSMDIELKVNTDDFVRSYYYTDIYKVLKTLKDKELADVDAKDINITSELAPNGGFLNCLLQYSIFNTQFDFRWQHIITPEYYMMKSSQPAAFVSEFSRNMKEKYYSLYDKEDRSNIINNLKKFQKYYNDVDGESKLLNLMCTWGYVGVQGALEELENETNIENFRNIREMDEENPYISIYAEIFTPLVKAIFDTYERIFDEHDNLGLGNKYNWLNVTKVNLKNLLISSIHDLVLDSYGEEKIDTLAANPHDLLIKEMLFCVFNSNLGVQILAEKTKKMFPIRNLPVSPDLIDQWFIIYRTIRKCYINANKIKYDLNFNDPIQRSDVMINPFSLTQEILSKWDMKMSAAKVYHHGLFSRNLLLRLTTPYKIMQRGNIMRFTIDLFDPEKIEEMPNVWFTGSYWFKHILNDEFLETDEYDDITMELQSLEPDLDAIEEGMESCEEVYGDYKNKMIKISERGRLKDAISIKIKMVILPGKQMNLSNLAKLRQISEHIIILTNKIPFRFTLTDDFIVLRSIDTQWPNNSSINPKFIFYVVISSTKHNKDFWENYLKAKVIDVEELNSIKTSGLFLIRNSVGAIENEYNLALNIDVEDTLAENLVNIEEDKIEEEKAKRELGGDAECENNELKVIDERIDALKKELYDFGVGEEQQEKYLVKLKEGKERIMHNEMKDKNYTWEDIFKQLENLLNQEKKKGKDSDFLKHKISDIMRKKKEPLQHEMISQVPLIFGGGRNRATTVNTALFKEQRIIAEFESLCPGLIWKIISGTLYIGDRTKNRWLKQLKLYKMVTPSLKRNKEGKAFLITLFRLILNDAKPTDDKNSDDDVWMHLLDLSTKYLIDDEDESDEEANVYDQEITEGSIGYKPSKEYKYPWIKNQ